MTILFASLLAFLLGALGAVLGARSARVVSMLGSLGAVVGAGLGALYAASALVHGTVAGFAAPWSVPNGTLRIGVDPLSSFFLVPLFVMAGITAVYGRTYLLHFAPSRSLVLPWVGFNVFVASMVLVVIARDAVLFLVAWETMSIAGYLLLTFEHEQAAVRRAGWVYLVATHIGVGFLIAAFLLFAHFHGSAELAPGALAEHRSAAALIFTLALVGFGAKAGLVPLHVWLPEAHAAAPSHVSALMSGVLIKLGLYGILRVAMLVGGPAAWGGPLLMALGLTGGALGIAMALCQRDAKRVLAYSSIENVGLIVFGLGMGFWGAESGRPLVALFGFVGALLHIWNHAAMKGLMFLAAGSILHGCHTKDLERLGGLMRRMPVTAGAMVLGAVAIAGLPPLNGFVSEWLLYSGLLHELPGARAAAGVIVPIAVAILSFIGAMAALCFVRLIGVALLGEPRSANAAAARESSPGMIVPLVLLAITVCGLSVMPAFLEPVLERVSAELLACAGASATVPISAVHLDRLGRLNSALLVALVGCAVAARTLWPSKRVRRAPTWGCGYLAPTTTMQYTARSFSEFFSTHLLPGRLAPRTSIVAPQGLFPKTGSLSVDTADPVMRGAYEPFFARWADRFERLRNMQQGLLHVYVVYILVTVVAALSWSAATLWTP